MQVPLTQNNSSVSPPIYYIIDMTSMVAALSQAVGESGSQQ